MTVQELLIEFEQQTERLDALRCEQDLAGQRILPESLAAELLEIEQAYSSRIATAESEKIATEKKLKSAVLEHGQSVAGQKFLAVLGQRRVTWDKMGLENYMKTNPYIRKFRKVGAAPVSIRLAATTEGG